MNNRSYNDLEPYPGLKPYQQKDAIFFFGREKLRQEITLYLRENKLTILYGESGVGKSSLIQAGIVNRLRSLAEENRKEVRVPKNVVIIFQNWEQKDLPNKLLEKVNESVAKATKDDLKSLEEKKQKIRKQVQKFKCKIRKQAKEKIYIRPSSFYLELKALTEIVGGENWDGKLFIILDQFESYFHHHPQKEDPFIKKIAEVVNSQNLAVNFLIVIRSDESYKIDKYFTKYIFNPIRKIELPPLDEPLAEDAIKKPIDRYNFIQSLKTRRLTLLAGEKGTGKSFILKTGVIPYWSAKEQDKEDHNNQEDQDNFSNTILFNNWNNENPQDKLVELIKTSIKIIKRQKTEEGEPQELSESKTLQEVLKQWKDLAVKQLKNDKANETNLLIILDQFENFKYDIENQNSFCQELKKVLTNQENLPVSILISIREDNLENLKTWIDNFKTSIPGWCDEYLEICEDKDSLGFKDWNTSKKKGDNSELKKAKIQGDEFSSKILEGIKRQKTTQVVTPYLQLVMTELWKGANSKEEIDDNKGKIILSLDLLEKIAKDKIDNQSTLTSVTDKENNEDDKYQKYIQKIIQKYVDDIFDNVEEEVEKEIEKNQADYFPLKYEKVLHENYRIIPQICFYLCSSSGDKRSISVKEIIDASEEEQSKLQLSSEDMLLKLESKKVEAILKYLTDRRILQVLSRENSTYYEVYFEGLIQAIQGWRTKHREQIRNRLYHQVLPSQALAQLRRNQWDLAALLASEAYKLYQEYNDDEYKEKHCPIDLSEIDEALREILKSSSYKSSYKSCPLDLKQDDWLSGNEHPRPQDFRQIVFSPDGNLFAASNQNGNIGLWYRNKNEDHLFPNDKAYKVIKNAHDAKNLVVGEFLDMGIAFSGDEKFLFSGARDGKIKIWDVRDFDKLDNAKPIDEYPPKNSNQSGEKEAFVSVAFNKKKNLLAAGSSGGNVWLWNVTQENKLNLLDSPLSTQKQPGSEKKGVKDNDKLIWSVAFNQEGNLLAAGGYDGIVYLWSVTDKPQLLRRLRGHTEEIFCVAFSPDGKKLASVSRDRKILLWKINQTNFKIIDTLLNAIKRLLKYEYTSLPEQKEGVRAIAFDSSSKRLASVSEDQTIRVWNLDNLKETPQVLHGHHYGICSVAFDPNNQKSLVSCSWDRTIRFWDLDTEPKIFKQPQKNEPDIDAIAVTFINHDNHERFAIGYADGTVIERSTDQSPDSKPLFKENFQNRMSLWEKLKYNFKQVKKVSAIAFFCQDDKLQKVALGSSESSIIWVWDIANKKNDRTITAAHKISSLAFSPDGKILVSSANEDEDKDQKKHTVKIWDLEAQKNLSKESRLPCEYTLPVTSIAFIPDSDEHNTYFALASTKINEAYNKGEITLWNVTQHKKISSSDPFEKTTGSVAPVVIAFSADGKYLASGSDSYYIKLWNGDKLTFITDLPQEEKVLPNRNFWVTAVAFGKDKDKENKDKWLASGRYDGSIQLWDLEHYNNKPIVLNGHTEKINAIAFSLDGKYLASASSDNTVRVWTVDTGELAEKVQRKLYRGLTDPEKEKYLGESKSTT